MRLPNDFDKAQAYEGGSFKMLPAGGYVCKVIDVKETQTKDGRPMIELSIDIMEGEYKEYFAEQYSRAVRYGNANPKWRCVLRQPLIKQDKTTNPRFKGTITALTDSNPNAMIVHQGNMNTAAMKNCVVGCLFREEHGVYQGKETIRSVPDYLVNVQKIRSGEYVVPAPKLLTEEDKDKLRVAQGFTEDASSELPF